MRTPSILLVSMVGALAAGMLWLAGEGSDDVLGARPSSLQEASLQEASLQGALLGPARPRRPVSSITNQGEVREDSMPVPEAFLPPVGSSVASAETPETGRVALDSEGPQRQHRQEEEVLTRQGTLPELVDALRDDDVPHNAGLAVGALFQVIRNEPNKRARVRDALEPHIASSDGQLSTLAIGMLHRISILEHKEGRATKPNPELLKVTLEWLAETPELDSYLMGLPSTYDLVVFALDHIDELEAPLVRALHNTEKRDPFLEAFVLGASKRYQFIGSAVPVLLPHLRDNGTSWDAVMSMEALRGFGHPVVPYLRAALPNADAQQRVCLVAVIEVLEGDLSRDNPSKGSPSLRRVTRKYKNPARSWSFRTSYRRVDSSIDR